MIKCNSIEYRKGFIEVRGDIHNDCINVEIWNIDPGVNITNVNLEDSSLKGESIIANTEIELSITNAEALISQLQEAIDVSRARDNTQQ
ncbi:hypothetical protein [Psychromonas antarctica]|uniref:hypothetical protein n=1 Tax=Psychromonas antarctica TaxID=67573 RepID=UPI001EE86618|nr:hypothetical protein [Psychromonas antarctica]MCG6202687.1 hypothetical protein [Psychromonas antarctica]